TPTVTEEAVHVPGPGPESLLDHLLPRFDVRQVHEAWVPAPADVVYSAVKQVTGREVRVLMPLEFLRLLPGFLIGRGPSWPDPSCKRCHPPELARRDSPARCPGARYDVGEHVEALAVVTFKPDPVGPSSAALEARPGHWLPPCGRGSVSGTALSQ